MTDKLFKLTKQYEWVVEEIKKEISKLEGTECNCDDTEEIDLVNTDGDTLGVDRLCGNCGGVICDRELL